MTQQVMDVTDLSDEELFKALSSQGIDVGLISDTTRRIYQNKLRRLLSPEVNDEQSHVNGNSDDEPFSDEDEDVNEDVEDEAVKGNEVLEEIVQQKVNGNKVIEKEEIPVPKIEPTVTRRKPAVNTDSLASNSFDIKSKETEKISSVKINTQKSADVKESSKSSNTSSSRTEAAPKRNGMAIWLQMLILIAVATVIYLIIANMEPAYTRQQLDS